MTAIFEVEVGGRIFRISEETIRKCSKSKLATVVKKAKTGSNTDTPFFDRNSSIFEAILDFYRSGSLHSPKEVCGEAFREELRFWGVSESNVSVCCWPILYGGDDILKIKSEIEKYDRSEVVDNNSFRMAVWKTLSDPFYSRISKVWSIVYLLLLALSFAIFCCETVEEFRVKINEKEIAMMKLYINFTNPKIEMYFTTYQHPAANWIYRAAQIIFTIDFYLRFFVSPSKKEFIKNVLNVLDFVIIPGFWASFAMTQFPWKFLENTYLTAFAGLKGAEVLRILRFFRLANQFKGLKILLLSVRASANELNILFASLGIVLLIFAAIEYQMEITNEHAFINAFEGLWWSCLTMTTVGYGDIVPITIGGRFFGGMCAVCGLLVLSMPVAMIADKFRERYSFHKNNSRHLRNVLKSKLQKAMSEANAAKNTSAWDLQSILESPQKTEKYKASDIHM